MEFFENYNHYKSDIKFSSLEQAALRKLTKIANFTKNAKITNIAKIITICDVSSKMSYTGELKLRI